jgi:hypothetical protein
MPSRRCRCRPHLPGSSLRRWPFAVDKQVPPPRSFQVSASPALPLLRRRGRCRERARRPNLPTSRSLPALAVLSFAGGGVDIPIKPSSAAPVPPLEQGVVVLGSVPRWCLNCRACALYVSTFRSPLVSASCSPAGAL